MRFRMSNLCIVVLTACFTSSLVSAQEQRSRDRARATVVLRTYEVGDLVVHVPDYALPVDSALASAQGGAGHRGGGFGGGGGMFGGGEMGGGFPGGAPMGASRDSFGPPPVTIESLRNAIVNVVAPETWAQARVSHQGENPAGYAGAIGEEGFGGEITKTFGEGRMEVVGTALVVSQTEEVHDAIGQLLDQLRQGSATRRTVSIDARWLLLNSDDLDRLVTTSDDGERRIDRKTLDEFTRRPTSLRGATKCFSGQAVYVISGTQRSFVSSYIPVVGSIEPPAPEVLYAVDTSRADIVFTQTGYGGEGAAFGGRGVGYQPVITTPNFGATLEVRPTVSVKGDDAVIDLKSTVTFPSPEQLVADPAAMAGMPPVDRVAIQLQKLATTLRVPLGEPVLVGGMTYLTPIPGDGSQPAPQQTPANPGEQRQLYLVIELR